MDKVAVGAAAEPVERDEGAPQSGIARSGPEEKTGETRFDKAAVEAAERPPERDAGILLGGFARSCLEKQRSCSAAVPA